MFAVTIDLDAYDTLPPRQLKAMLRALRFADEGGVVHASLSMLAMPGMSRSTAHRELGDLTAGGYIARQQRPEGGFLWRIGRRFRMRNFPPAGNCRRPATINAAAPPDAHGANNADRGYLTEAAPPNGTPVPPAETPVPHRGTTDSRATPAVRLSSVSKEETSEREQEGSPSADLIPSGWEEAAAAERRLAGLGPVNLPCEWRKLIAYSEGARITIWRWRGWALKARGDAAQNSLETMRVSPTPTSAISAEVPGDERQQRQARDWVRRGFWLRDGSWGPAPDRPGCQLPAALVAWCLAERAALAA